MIRVKKHTGKLLAGVTVGAALVAAGCGSSSSSSSGTSASATTSSAGTATTSASGAAASIAAHRRESGPFVAPGPAIDGTAAKGKALWFVPVSAVIPVVGPQSTGVKQAASALGMSYHMCDGKFIPATEAACIKQAVNAGAAGIVTDAIDPLTVSTAVAYAGAHKVPIMTISDLGTDTAGVRFIPTDLANAPVAADWIAADAGAGGASVIAATVSGDKATETEAQAFRDELTKQCPKCKVIDVEEGPSSSSNYTSSVSTALLKNPDTKYVFAQFDFLTPPVERAIKQAGHKVKLVSTTATLNNLQEIKGGGLQVADIGVNPNYAGWLAVDGLLRMMAGKPGGDVSKLPVRAFDATNIASLPLTSAAAQTGEWWGATTYRDEFQKLWGLG